MIHVGILLLEKGCKSEVLVAPLGSQTGRGHHLPWTLKPIDCSETSLNVGNLQSYTGATKRQPPTVSTYRCVEDGVPNRPDCRVEASFPTHGVSYFSPCHTINLEKALGQHGDSFRGL